jgi:hypothetical protein
VALRDAMAQAERAGQERAAAAEAMQGEVAALWDTLARASISPRWVARSIDSNRPSHPKRTGNRQRGEAIAGRRALPDTNAASEPIVTEAA